MRILVKNITIEAKEIIEDAGHEVVNVDYFSDSLINYINDESIEGVIFDNVEDFNSDMIEACMSLKLLAFKDNVEDNSDVQYVKEQGIEVVSASESVSIAKAELAFAHLLGMVRFLHQSNREMPLEGDMIFNQLHDNFIGTELRGKTIGIIGMNTTGIELAKIGIGLGMKPLMTDHQPKSVLVPLEFFDGQSIEFTIDYSDFNEVLTKSDFVVLNTKTDSSYIIDKEQIKKLKKGVGLINLESGAINEIALLNAIEEKRVAYAGLDAFEHQPTPEIQLLMNPELSLSPNIGAQTFETQLKIHRELANLIANID